MISVARKNTGWVRSAARAFAPAALLCAVLLMAGCTKTCGGEGAGDDDEPVDTNPAIAPDGWMVICGTTDSYDAAKPVIAQLRAAGFADAAVVRTDLYTDLTPGLSVISAGLIPDKAEAKKAVETLDAHGVTCTMKQTARRDSDDRPAVAAADMPDTIFVGDGTMVWGCVDRREGWKPYGECVNRLDTGSVVVRPAAVADACPAPYAGQCRLNLTLGHEAVRAASVSKPKDESPCGDIATYVTSSRVPSIGVPQVETLIEAQVPMAAIRAALEKRLGEEMPALRMTAGVRVDLDNDGKPELLLDLVSGFTPGAGNDQPMLLGPVLHSVAVWAADGSVATPLYEHFAPHAKAEEDYYTAHIYGYLAGLADLDGDGSIEVLIVNGYHEGEGMDVLTYRAGVVGNVMSNGCGA